MNEKECKRVLRDLYLLGRAHGAKGYGVYGVAAMEQEVEAVYGELAAGMGKEYEGVVTGGAGGVADRWTVKRVREMSRDERRAWAESSGEEAV